MANTVSTVATRALLRVCGRLGLDPDALLEAAGLEASAFEGPDARIERSRSYRLWTMAYERSGDPHLSLHVAEGLEWGEYKVIDFVIAASPHLAEAVERLCRYFPIVDPRAALTAETEGAPTLRVTLPGHEGLIPPPAAEYTLAAIALRLRAAAGGAPLLRAVTFPFAAPSDASEHTRVFGVTPRFGAPDAALVFLDDAWRRPMPRADPALLSVLDEHARLLLQRVPALDDLVSRVQAAIDGELQGGEPTLARVAKTMGMGDRTLQRRLSDEGSAFGAVLDGQRRQRALGYLREPDLSLAEIAWLLGFSDQSALTRAFKRWTGKTPGKWRAQERGTS